MRIKTFRARTMRGALTLIREEFGDGASILHTREVAPGPVSRLWRGKMIEVAATPDRSPLAEQAERAALAVPNHSAELSTASASSEFDTLPSVASEDLPSASDVPSGTDGALVRYAQLVEADFNGPFARELVRSIDAHCSPESAADWEAALRDELMARFPVGGPIRVESGNRRIVALVGPTGVGKTTTLAKLAANFRVRDNRRVGVVTVDTYRVAAVDQLRTYAQIIDLPMEVVADESEMRDALDRLADLDLILIDTAGRSPRDAARIEELRRLLDAAAPDETHLVASTTTGPHGLAEAFERFSVVNPTSVLLTKLDESPSLGHIAAPVAELDLPISYLTDGQSVPEDIRIAESADLAERLLGGDRS